MRNFVQPGEVVTVVAPYAVNSGQGVKVGQLFGVGAFSASSAANVEVRTLGVFDLDKINAASNSIAAGANVHWDDTNLKATVSATSNLRIGVALAACANTDTTVRVRLHGAW